MFPSPKKEHTPMPMPETPSAVPKQSTVIARGVRLDGDFVSQGDVLIDGEVQGTVKTGGLLTVGPEASLKAEVDAVEAVIAGRVEGNIKIAKRLQLKSTSKLTGDITCETLSIEAGASVNGKVSCGGTT